MISYNGHPNQLHDKFKIAGFWFLLIVIFTCCSDCTFTAINLAVWNLFFKLTNSLLICTSMFYVPLENCTGNGHSLTNSKFSENKEIKFP